MAKFYEVDDKKKIVKVDMKHITDEEFDVVKKYQIIGYEIVSVEKIVVKEKVLRLNAKTIEDYLKANAPEDLALFEEKSKELIEDKNGKERKNAAGAKEWFMTTYPKTIDKEMKKQIDEYLSKNKKTLDKVYKKYVDDKAKKADADVYTKEQYTKRLYWTNIYTRAEAEEEEQK